MAVYDPFNIRSVMTAPKFATVPAFQPIKAMPYFRYNQPGQPPLEQKYQNIVDARSRLSQQATQRGVYPSGNLAAPQTYTPADYKAEMIQSGWYTPQAQQAIQKMPWERGPLPAGAAAYFDPQKNKIFYDNSLSGPTYDYPREQYNTAQHEQNHAFDWQYQQQSQMPVFRNNALQTTARYFPGMGLKPLLDTTNPPWGGTREMYPAIGGEPWRFQSMKQYYPQYTAQAFDRANADNPLYSNRNWYFEQPAAQAVAKK